MILPRKLLALSVAVAMSSSLLATRLMAEDVVAKFDGSKPNVTVKGYQVTVVQITLLSNGAKVVLAIPNGDPVNGKPAAPRGDIAGQLAKIKPGEIVKVDAVKGELLGPTLNSIEAYEVKPGEDSPNGYIFVSTADKTVGKLTVTEVHLTKFGKEYVFQVPTRKNEKGEMEQDPDIAAAVGKLQEKNSVYVRAVSNKLVIIEPYTDPAVGKLTKLADVDVDGHKTPSAEVELDNGKTVVLLVPVKQTGKIFTPDSAVAMQLKKVHVNSMVQFICHEDGDKTWLREIVPGPKVAPEKKLAPIESK